MLLILTALFACDKMNRQKAALNSFEEKKDMKFEKYEGNPVLGGKEMGVCFDVYVSKENGRYRMDFSWRTKKSLAVSFSDDGVNWSAPEITLSFDDSTGWEDHVNRNCVLFDDGKYKMWYTGQARNYSFIGYAESDDGVHFRRVMNEPIMIPEYPYEKESVMNPCVIRDGGIYKMWYAAGETYEPNVLCYAESSDGIHFKKSKINPIFVRGREEWEKSRVGGCQVIKTEEYGYIMFYIGYRDIDTACICAARSENGITGWKRLESNPLVCADAGTWDENSVYKPSFFIENDKITVWYNGRRKTEEYIGLAVCKHFEKNDLLH